MVWAGLAAAFALSGGARGDELHLVDGRIVVGKVSQQDGEYVVSFEGGASARYAAADVLRVENKPTLRERYENLKGVTDENDFKAQMELGKWCQLNNLPDEARTHFLRAVALQPEDAKARQSAGFIRFENKWMTRDEALAAQGKTIYKGKEMSIAEADALRQREETLRLQNEGYSKAWRLLQSVDASSYARTRAELQQMGALAMGAVLRSTNDGDARVRALCIDLLGTDTTDETRKELFARLRYEEKSELVRKIAQQLAKRPERDRILQQALDWCVRAPNAITRQRTWLILRYAGDKRVIPVLIEAAEYCPVPPEPKKKTGQVQAPGWQTSELYDKPPKTYFPACEALNFLTGANNPPNRIVWTNWWKSHEETFDFSRKSSTAEPTGDPDKDDKTDKDAESNKKEAKPGEKSAKGKQPEPATPGKPTGSDEVKPEPAPEKSAKGPGALPSLRLPPVAAADDDTSPEVDPKAPKPAQPSPDAPAARPESALPNPTTGTPAPLAPLQPTDAPGGSVAPAPTPAPGWGPPTFPVAPSGNTTGQTDDANRSGASGGGGSLRPPVD